MPDPIERLLLLLAVSDLRERDIYQALRTLEKVGPAEFTDTVFMLRQRLRGILPPSLPRSILREKNGYDLEVVEDVTRLLLREADLPSSEAGVRLHEALSSTSQEVPPFRPKEGFQNWLISVSQAVPSSVLLHHATRIRNESVHARTDSDWPLRKRD